MKKTERQMLEMIKEVCANNSEIVEFCNHKLELLDKKKSRATENAKQTENNEIMKVILNELTRINKAVTITELQNESEALKDYSNQKLSALLKKLVNSNEVERTVIKKKSYFSVVKQV